ncbi:MAG TPA: M14 family zinc carboxypeptidase, partial [Chitinophagaceae bacterium]|nr:M14 family zinc carboxypeptidase [Chitinophagaceae bacterium]
DSMKLRYPNLITQKQVVSNTLTTVEGRPLYYVKISDNPDADESEPEILYTALHHAREPLSASQLIYYMWYLLENYRKLPAIRSLVDSTEMFFIPCLNPDGYIYNQTTNPNGGGLWRKNRRNNGDGNFGIDLNRNYGYKWGYDNIGSSPYTYSDTYRGTAPFSEAETQIVRDFCNQHSFKYALNNHTYGNVLVLPYSYGTKTFTPDSAEYSDDAQNLVKCNGFSYGIAIQTVGYTANGDSDDWMYGEQGSKPKIFAFTPETGSPLDGFWPGKNRIIPLCRANLDMNLTAATLTKESAYPPVAEIISKKNISATIMQCTPNPAGNYTNISFSIPQNIKGNWQLKIADGAGAVLKTIALNSNNKTISVSTSQLHAGLYYCSISNGNTVSNVMKLFVVK